MKTRYIILIAGIIVLSDVLVYAQSVRRVRNEGSIHCRASNVMGSGNLSLFTGITSSINHIALRADLFAGAQIGIAEIIQIQAQASLEDFSSLGPAQAHLQLTTPENDRLRFFGFAISADLYLSTAQDTFSLVTESSKPEYSPFLKGSIIADIDWLALWSRFPLKTYVTASMVDNPQALHQYHQARMLLGMEWKMQRHSLFVEAGSAFYKEKRTRENLTGDDSFEQWYAWIQPGGRLRLRDKFSITGGLEITVATQTRKGSNLTPGVVGFDIRFEAPIVFKETGAEAIRTLVFIEQSKDQGSDPYSEHIIKNGVFSKYNDMVEGLDLQEESFNYQSENQQLREKREQIQKKMEEIEAILEETK